jgi:hypothetical protein
MTTVQETRPARKPRTVRPAHGVCSLVLTINGTAYRIRPIRPDRGFGVVRAFRLTKADGSTVYDVSQSIDGCSCDCPSFVFDRDGTNEPCKHIASLRAVGILD